MKATTRIVTIIALLLFVWYLIADHMTPYTVNARVKAIMTPIVPQVSGYVSKLNVTNGQVVNEGALISEIDPRPYIYEVDSARAALQSATQSVGASSAALESNRAAVTAAEINLQNMQLQSSRIFKLELDGLAPKAQGDNARANLKTAKSQLASAKADLERATKQLGELGANNPQILSAMTNLSQAELVLEWTRQYAPAKGVIVDLNIAKGHYAYSGQDMMSFISFDEVWVEANIRENSLSNIKEGNPVEILLDLYPGRIFKGTVSSITRAAAGERTIGGLPDPKPVDGWMRDPQRFPVRIKMDGYEVGNENADIQRFHNGQADVIVYTSNNSFMNFLGAAYIRFMSILSFAY